MEDELKSDDLLRRDVTNIVSLFTPYIPYLGILSGSITVGKHVSSHMMNKIEKQPNNQPEGHDENKPM